MKSSRGAEVCSEMVWWPIPVFKTNDQLPVMVLSGAANLKQQLCNPVLHKLPLQLFETELSLSGLNSDCLE